MKDKTRTWSASKPGTVPPGAMSYETRRKLGLAEGPLNFRDNECAIVEYLPTVAHNHCWQASIYSMPWYDMGRPGYFRDYCACIGPERPYVTLRSKPTAWSQYALRRMVEETGITVLSNAEADGYLVAWKIYENRFQLWPRWLKLAYLASAKFANRMFRTPPSRRRPTMRQVWSGQDQWT